MVDFLVKLFLLDFAMVFMRCSCAKKYTPHSAIRTSISIPGRKYGTQTSPFRIRPKQRHFSTLSWSWDDIFNEDNVDFGQSREILKKYQKARSLMKQSAENLEEGVEMMKELATEYPPAMVSVASILLEKVAERRRVPREEIQNALELLNNSAARGSSIAQCILGVLHLNGWHKQKSPEIAEELFQLSAEKDNPASLHFLALLQLMKYHCVKEAELLLRESSDRGWPYAKNDLAIRYLQRHDDPVEIQTATNLLSFASEKDNHAKTNFALLNLLAFTPRYLFVGIGEQLKWEKNLPKALNLLFQAASNGEKMALHVLEDYGLFHVNRENRLSDLDTAAWILEEKVRDSGSACMNLARCYLFGIGLKRNTSKAMEYIHKAAKLGDAEANWRLAYHYMKGLEVEKNIHLSLGYHRNSLELLTRMDPLDEPTLRQWHQHPFTKPERVAVSAMLQKGALIPSAFFFMCANALNYGGHTH